MCFCIYNTVAVKYKTYNKSASVGQVLCVQMTMYGMNSIKLSINLKPIEILNLNCIT